MKKLTSNHILSLLLILALASGTLGAATIGDYDASPPFLTSSVPPNLLLLIDNSASMYDLAYVDDQKYCYDDTFSDANAYAGYFDPETWYKYDLTDGEFEAMADAAAADTYLNGAGGTKYSNSYVGIAVDTNVSPEEVKAFAAKGNYLNWATASKFDIEKRILTGGKFETAGNYGAPNDALVMESRGCVGKRFVKQVAVADPASNTYYLTLGVRAPQEARFPAWENNTAYIAGDIVTDVGAHYIAQCSFTSNGTGVADDDCGGACTPCWQAYTGARWTNGAAYAVNDIVSDNGEMYIAATAGTANGTGAADDQGVTWEPYHVTHIEIYPVTDTGFDNSDCQLAVEELQKASPNQGQLKGYIDGCMGYESGGGQTKEADSNGAFNHSIHNCWYMAKHGTWPSGAGPTQSIQNDCEHIYDTWQTPPWDITPDDMGYPCYGVWNIDQDNDVIDDPPEGYVGRCWKPGGEPTLECTKTHPQTGECQKWEWVGGGAGGWDAAAYADVATCIETALQDYCGLLEIPEVIDPTDQAGETGEFWNIPAVLIDSGAVAQIGQPLAVLKGYIEQTAAPTGLVQEYASEAHMGVMRFNEEGSDSECAELQSAGVQSNCADASNRDGAQVTTGIDRTADIAAHTTALVADVNDIVANSWTPIAEAMYNALGYYTQNSARRLHVDDFDVNPGVDGTDPVTEWCQANNVLIITDGASTADKTSDLTTFAATAGQNDGDTDPASCGSLAGSSLLDDVTWYAKQGTDIYPEGQGQLHDEDKQNITTYIVVAGSMRSTGSGDECSPEVLLEDAADYGQGVDDPGAVVSLYQATNLSELEAKLRAAFEAIVGGASSGTAASVVSAARRGEGAVYQAVFYLTYEDDNGTEVAWIGKLHALFVDQYGNMREDTDENNTMSLTSDKIVVLFFEPTAGRTKAKVYSDSDGDGETDGSPTIVEIDDIKYLWEAGEELAERTADTRDIYTWIDTNSDNAVGGGTSIDSDEFITFSDSVAGDLQPYLGVGTADEATKLINWIRGTDQDGYRSRTINVNGTDRVWKLGDIIYSTPTLIGKPQENWEFIYSDTTYKTFKSQYEDRRHVLYVGANDGMLHAFNAGFYDSATSTFEVGTSTPSYSTAVPALGEELWAYVPYNLLPHLQWLKQADYGDHHVYYVDLKPRVIDAQIFAANDDHPGGWGTVLVCGMRFGGGPITVNEQDVNYDWDGDGIADEGRSFTSSYFAFDITNPEVPPTLLWEFTDADLGFTTSYPGIVYVDQANNDWWLGFGSGPTAYDGTSTQLGQTYVVSLKTGVEVTGSPVGTNLGGALYSAMGDVISVDVDINLSQCTGTSCTYTPDVYYIGCSQGTMWRVSCLDGASAGTATPLVSLGNTKPITAAPSASQDRDGRLWLYFGTGKFYDAVDKVEPGGGWPAQSLVGVKEPIDWNDSDGDGDTDDLTIDWCGSAETVPQANLLDVTNYSVFEGGHVDTNGDLAEDTTFEDLVLDIKQTTADTDDPKHYDGWIINITGGERCVTKPTILGGITTYTTFTPDDDACAFEGESRLYALYYTTGTAYYEPIIDYDEDTMTVEGETLKEISKVLSLGEGVAATPSLHVGEKEGVRAFVQSSTGEIEIIEEINLPEAYRSKPLLWLQPGD